MLCLELAPVDAKTMSGERCESLGLQIINSGSLFTCIKGENGLNWNSGFRCKTPGQMIRINSQTYVCQTVRNSKVWTVSRFANSGMVLFDTQGLDAKCESGKSGTSPKIPVRIRGAKTIARDLRSGGEFVELGKGKYSAVLLPFVCNGRNYVPVLSPVSFTVQVGKTTTVVLRYTVALDKDSKFEKEFKRLTGLDSQAWDLKVDQDPLTYKIKYTDLKKYAKGPLCSYIATGLDDFTLGSYISNEVTYDADIQSALLNATRIGYGCRST